MDCMEVEFDHYFCWNKIVTWNKSWPRTFRDLKTIATRLAQTFRCAIKNKESMRVTELAILICSLADIIGREGGSSRTIFFFNLFIRRSGIPFLWSAANCIQICSERKLFWFSPQNTTILEIFQLKFYHSVTKFSQKKSRQHWRPGHSRFFFSMAALAKTKVPASQVASDFFSCKSS